MRLRSDAGFSLGAVLVRRSLQLSLARAQVFASARLAFGAVRSVDANSDSIRPGIPI
jgi:hypothetical protein